MPLVITKPFELEDRYLVIKYSDIDKLSNRAQDILFDTAITIDQIRAQEGKQPISGVFIDKRWEVYPSAVELVQAQYELDSEYPLLEEELVQGNNITKYLKEAQV